MKARYRLKWAVFCGYNPYELVFDCCGRPRYVRKKV